MRRAAGPASAGLHTLPRETGAVVRLAGARLGWARQGLARLHTLRISRCAKVRRDLAAAVRDKSGLGLARHGLTHAAPETALRSQALALRGAARQGKARLGNHTREQSREDFKQQQMNETEPTETVRLPLWKNCLDNMRKQGLAYGQTWSAEFFEKELRCDRDAMPFGLAISEIRRQLESDGYYLSGRGQKLAQFVILQPEANVDVMKSYQRAASDALSRGVILGTNTRLDLLSEENRKRHESLLERLATKAVLLRRSESIAKAVRKSQPKLLEK